MLSGFCKRTLQFFKLLLLPLSFSFSCIQTVQFLLAVAVFQFLLLLFFLPDTADSREDSLRIILKYRQLENIVKSIKNNDNP